MIRLPFRHADIFSRAKRSADRGLRQIELLIKCAVEAHAMSDDQLFQPKEGMCVSRLQSGFQRHSGAFQVIQAATLLGRTSPKHFAKTHTYLHKAPSSEIAGG